VTIAGIVSGEYDHVPEVNDAFLNVVGYGREDLASDRMQWPDLTPPEYAALDELAREEGPRFGACTPYEKKLIRKDGTQVPVLVATAVLSSLPSDGLRLCRNSGKGTGWRVLRTRSPNSDKTTRR
jgi:formate hydrogenlyase transcriptional activator